MATDLGFNIENNSFRLRGVGIIINNNKVLMVHDEKHGYYYSVGGAVHINETTSSTAIREVHEETGLYASINRLLFIEENFFIMDEIKHHEVTFFYLMDCEDVSHIGDRLLDNNDEGLCWLNIDKLQEYNVYPHAYVSILKDMPQEIVHIVNKEY